MILPEPKMRTLEKAMQDAEREELKNQLEDCAKFRYPCSWISYCPNFHGCKNKICEMHGIHIIRKYGGFNSQKEIINYLLRQKNKKQNQSF